MNSNELLYYLRGIFELVPTLSDAQIQSIRTEILRATAVGVAGSGECKGCKDKPKKVSPPAHTSPFDGFTLNR